MSSLLSRFTTFVPNTTILSNDHNQELNRIVNLLNGTTTNLKAVLKTSDVGDPPLEIDQLSTGPLLKLFQGGVLKAQVSNSGNWLFNQSAGFIGDQNGNEYLKFATTASAVNELSITNAATGNRPVIGPTGGDTNIGLDISPKGTGQLFITGSSPVRLPTGVSPSNDDDAARKKYVDDSTVAFGVTVGTEADPSTASVTTESDRYSFFVPDGNTMTITKLKVKFQQGSHTAGAGNVLSYTIRVRGATSGSTDLGPISLNDTNNTIHNTYTLDISDHVLTAGDSVTYFISTRTGTITERAVSIGFVGTQKRI